MSPSRERAAPWEAKTKPTQQAAHAVFESCSRRTRVVLADSSTRCSRASIDFTCTGQNQPIRSQWAMPRASLRSVSSQRRPPPYDPVMMLKVLVLQTLYTLSDEQTEYQLKDR
jgi:hypothetical protein